MKRCGVVLQKRDACTIWMHDERSKDRTDSAPTGHTMTFVSQPAETAAPAIHQMLVDRSRCAAGCANIMAGAIGYEIMPMLAPAGTGVAGDLVTVSFRTKAPRLFAKNVTVGLAPFRGFDDRSNTLRDAAKEVVASIDDLVRRIPGCRRRWRQRRRGIRRGLRRY